MRNVIKRIDERTYVACVFEMNKQTEQSDFWNFDDRGMYFSQAVLLQRFKVRIT